MTTALFPPPTAPACPTPFDAISLVDQERVTPKTGGMGPFQRETSLTSETIRADADSCPKIVADKLLAREGIQFKLQDRLPKGHSGSSRAEIRPVLRVQISSEEARRDGDVPIEDPCSSASGRFLLGNGCLRFASPKEAFSRLARRPVFAFQRDLGSGPRRNYEEHAKPNEMCCSLAFQFAQIWVS